MVENNLKNLENLSKYLTNLESEFSQFWQLIPSLLCICEDGKFIKINPSWTSLLGYTADEIKKGDLYALVHPDDLKATQKSIKKLTSTGKLINFINRVKHKDGTYVYLNWSCSYDKINNRIYAIAQDVYAHFLGEELKVDFINTTK